MSENSLRTGEGGEGRALDEGAALLVSVQDGDPDAQLASGNIRRRVRRGKKAAPAKVLPSKQHPLLVGEGAEEGLLGNQPTSLVAGQAPRAAGLTPPCNHGSDIEGDRPEVFLSQDVLDLVPEEVRSLLASACADGNRAEARAAQDKLSWAVKTIP